MIGYLAAQDSQTIKEDRENVTRVWKVIAKMYNRVTYEPLSDRDLKIDTVEWISQAKKVGLEFREIHGVNVRIYEHILFFHGAGLYNEFGFLDGRRRS